MGSAFYSFCKAKDPASGLWLNRLKVNRAAPLLLLKALPPLKECIAAKNHVWQYLLAGNCPSKGE